MQLHVGTIGVSQNSRLEEVNRRILILLLLFRLFWPGAAFVLIVVAAGSGTYSRRDIMYRARQVRVFRFVFSNLPLPWI
jgi:hypothetical protein